MSNACCRIEDFAEARFFKALSDPNRIAMLAWLASRNEPTIVNDINMCCPIHISVVSRHLKILEQAGIVKAEKQGRQTFYSVCYPNLVQKLRNLADAIEACCPT